MTTKKKISLAEFVSRQEGSVESFKRARAALTIGVHIMSLNRWLEGHKISPMGQDKLTTAGIAIPETKEKI